MGRKRPAAELLRVIMSKETRSEVCGRDSLRSRFLAAVPVGVLVECGLAVGGAEVEFAVLMGGGELGLVLVNVHLAY